MTVSGIWYTCQNIIIKEMGSLEEHHNYHLSYIKIQQFWALTMWDEKFQSICKH